MQPQVLPTWTRGLGDWRTRWLTVMARLKDGVSRRQATPSVNVLYGQLLREDLATIKTPSDRFRVAFLQKRLELLPGGRGTSGLRDEAKTPLLVLMGMVGLVLLIACANVANLLMARASSRQKEIAVRLALGASRGRLVRQLLVESVVFSLAGGLLGIGFAVWTGTLLLRALPSEQAARVLTADPDLRVGLFALGLALLTGIVFGLVPALQSTRPQLAPTLKNETAAVAGRHRALPLAQGAGGRPGRALPPAPHRRGALHAQPLEPALAQPRLRAGAPAGLLRRPRPERLRAGAPPRPLQAAPGRPRGRARREVGRPWPKSALMTDSNSSSTVRVEGYEAKEEEDMNPNFNTVAPGFFSTLGIPLLAGRDFNDGDVAGAPKVAVVNEAFARYFYGTRARSGAASAWAAARARKATPSTIVGVVRDSKAASLREKPIRFVYVPYTQQTNVGPDDVLRALQRGRGGARQPHARAGAAGGSPACPSPR